MSNFAACEDPDTGHILITLKRVDWHATGYYNCASSSADWFSPPWERFPSCWYRVAVPEA